MLNFKKIFSMAQLKTKHRYQWLVAVCSVVYILILNHCSAVLGMHLDILEKHRPMGLNPGLIHRVNATSTLLTCREIAHIKQGDAIGRGTTKEVFSGSYRGGDVAIKMVTPRVKDVQACLHRRAYRQKEECFEYANYKLMKEIAYSLQLNGDRFLKMMGYCVRGDAVTSSVRDQGIISVVEVGKKLNEYRLKQFTWPQRLQVGLDIAELLLFLENSPLGSLEIGDFKLSQFFVVEGQRLKVGDLDDMSSEERACIRSRDCSILGENAGIECVNATCVGINAKANILLATVELLEPLFQNPPGPIAGRLALLLRRLSHYEMDAYGLRQSLLQLKDAFDVL